MRLLTAAASKTIIEIKRLFGSWSLMMGSPSVSMPAVDLSSAYDIHDPVHEFVIPDSKPTAPSVPVAAAATSNGQTQSTPEKPVGGFTPSTQSSEPASSSPTPTELPGQKHPNWLLQNATDLGLHPLLVERLDTPELTQYVMSELRKIREIHRQDQVAAAVTQPQSQTKPTQSGQPTQPAEFDWGIHEDLDDHGNPIKKQFTDADVHPALAHHIKEQAKRITALESHLAAIQQTAVVAGQSQIDRQFDAAFNKLGGAFGSGTASSLQGKPELEKRVLVYNAVKAMFSTLPAEVRESMGIEKAVFTFAKSMFGADALAAAATPQSNGQPTAEQFRTGGVGQPTLRRGNDTGLGRDKAIEDAQKWWKQNNADGGIPSGGQTSIDEFFPLQ